jgi:KDEL-tailed cysteine endopeptidase
MDDAFKYAVKYGMMSLADYPYKAADGSCHYDASKVVAKISSYHDVPARDEEALQQAISQQPVSVAVDAGGFGWQFYWNGVMDSSCGTQLDHGVLAVGYNRSASKPYYIVKNSWGTSWGMDGYIELALGCDECGIALSASYPIV